MKVIIAGSRDIIGPASLIEQAVEASAYYITEVVSGGARGVDTLGEEYAIRHRILLTRFPVSAAEWRANPRTAGRERNRRMARYAHALIAIWDGQSSGTRHMIETARSSLLLVYIHRVTPEEAT